MERMSTTWDGSPHQAYALGVRAAWLDWRSGTLDCAVGARPYGGLPHTIDFWEGYAAVMRRPPAERWPFVRAYWPGGGGGCGEAPSQTP